MEKFTRRATVGMGLSMISTAAFADRGEARSARGLFGSRNIYCNNDGVPVSQIAGRISTIADFDVAGACQMIEDSFEGPYFMCTSPVGKDITGGRAGTPLTVAMRVQDAACNPIAHAAVDIWACDAEGHYAGYSASPDEFATTGDHVKPETDERFCRGVLATDADGIAEFETIYPGFYAGRAIHIHFKVHVGDKAFVTNQALMPEDVNARVLEQPPYNQPRGARRVLNAEEGDEFATYTIAERDGRLLAILNVGVST